MKKTHILILFFAANVCFGQNLVNNWSFEDTVACPSALTQIDKAVGWMSFKFTPDYFNSCAIDTVIPSLSVPHNVWGDQLPYTGNAYSGFIAFSATSLNTREYVCSQLTQSLIASQKYFIAFYISTAFGYSNGQYPGLACNNIGVRFTSTAYSQANPLPVNNIAQFVNTTIINDTILWTKISGSFIADSAYQYLCIGNFFDDSNTSYVQIGTNPSVAYYYLDDVKLSTDSNFVNSVKEYSSNHITIFTNHARDWIVVEGKEIHALSIYDISDRLCLSQKVSLSSTKINTAHLSKGVYLIVAETKKEIIRKKILIQ